MSYTYKRLSQWYWSEAAIKEVEPHIGVDVEEAGYVDVVREGGGQTQDTNHALGALHLKHHHRNISIKRSASKIKQMISMLD